MTTSLRRIKVARRWWAGRCAVVGLIHHAQLVDGLRDARGTYLCPECGCVWRELDD